MRTGELIQALRKSAAATQVADRRRSLMTEAADRLEELAKQIESKSEVAK
jgi:hypothetical protein